MQGGKNQLWFLDCERKTTDSCINCIEKGKLKQKSDMLCRIDNRLSQNRTSEHERWVDDND